jgi:hypothetical protein
VPHQQKIVLEPSLRASIAIETAWSQFFLDEDRRI